jgi:hypothetical protein
MILYRLAGEAQASVRSALCGARPQARLVTDHMKSIRCQRQGVDDEPDDDLKEEEGDVDAEHHLDPGGFGPCHPGDRTMTVLWIKNPFWIPQQNLLVVCLSRCLCDAERVSTLLVSLRKTAIEGRGDKSFGGVKRLLGHYQRENQIMTFYYR